MSEYEFQMPNAPEEYTIELPDIDINKINFSALDYQTIQKLIIEYISLYHKDKFNDFAAHNAVTMISEIIAYIGHLLSNRQDLQANESFLPTARTPFAVDQHLKILNNKLQRPTSATVEVTLEIETPISTTVNIPAGTSFTLFSADGERIVYEIFKAPGNWEDSIEILPGVLSTKAYGVEGSFVDTLQYTAEGIDNEEFIIYDDSVLDEPFIINVSIGAVTSRWQKVDNIERYSSNDEVYELIYSDDGILVKFGDNLHGSRLPEGATISIKYRTGGGVRGRIDARAIDEYRDINLSSTLGTTQVHFINYVSSTGGEDIESIEDAKKRASAESFSLLSAVTSEDYITIAKNFSHSVYGSVSKAAVTVRTGVSADLGALIDQIRNQDTTGQFVLNDEEAENLLLNNYVNKNLVEVYILTSGSTGLAKPSGWLKTGLKNHLENIGPITDQVNVYDGNFKNINLEIDIVINYNSDISVVKNNVETALSEFFSNTSFEMGEGFYLSKLNTKLQSLSGIYRIRIKSPNYDIVPTSSVTSTDNNKIGISEVVNLNSSKIKYYRKSNN